MKKDDIYKILPFIPIIGIILTIIAEIYEKQTNIGYLGVQTLSAIVQAISINILIFNYAI